MGFGLNAPIPAVSVRGTDQYLIVGVEGRDCIVIDQDGDMRLVDMSDLTTKWVYLDKQQVWFSTQDELEDFEDATPEDDPG